MERLEHRRRLLQGSGIIKSPYPPDYVDDGRVWCYCTIGSTGNYTVVYLPAGSSHWTALEIDGVEVSASKTQTLSAGDHLLKFTLGNPNTMPEGMFRSISLYSMIIFPGTVTTIGNMLFYPCDTATKVLMDKSKITSIGQRAFQQAQVFIGDLDFPNLTELRENAFDRHYGGTAKIKSLGSITTLPSSCFSQSPYKTYVIPATVTSIGDQALLSWDYDKTIICHAVTPPTVGSMWVYRAPMAIYVPAESVEAYKIATGWSSYANKIQAI